MSEPSGPTEVEPALDPSHREAVVDLLGALAYGELTAFSRLAADADLAPSLSAKAALARFAVTEFKHFELLRGRLESIDTDPDAAMEPFVAPLDAFHERTAPQTWLEGLVKAYVGDGIARDFYREISAFLDPRTHELVTTVLQDEGHAEFVLREVRGAIDADPRVAGRLALWARRLVGEALSQAQRVAADRDGLTALLVGSGPSAGRAGVGGGPRCGRGSGRDRAPPSRSSRRAPRSRSAAAGTTRR